MTAHLSLVRMKLTAHLQGKLTTNTQHTGYLKQPGVHTWCKACRPGENSLQK